MSLASRDLIAGVAVGAIVGTAGLALGPVGLVLAMTVLVAAGVYIKRRLFLAGSLGAVGVLWLALIANSVLQCSRTSDFCGQANFVPLLVASAALIGASVVLGVSAARRS
jgi:hypothetical protein